MNIHFAWIRTAALILAMTSCVAATHAAGTIGFGNSLVTGTKWYQGGGITGPVPAFAQIVYGVFWGTNRDELTLVQPLGTNFAGGIIFAPMSSSYKIPGTESGQTVFMQIKGWPASYGTNWIAAQSQWTGYGETRILQITLAGAPAAGAVVWQPAWGTNPNRFYPLILNAPLTPPATAWIGTPPVDSSIEVDEGNNGAVGVRLSVWRHDTTGAPSNPLNYTSRVLLTTEDLTATGDQDYVRTNILVTFSPGETHQFATIYVTGNDLQESPEEFRVKLIDSPDFIAFSSTPYLINIRKARVTSVIPSAEGAVVSFPTTSWQRYSVESSPDLTSWSVVPGAQNIVGTGGTVQVTDSSQACCSPRFYRTRILP